MKKVKPERLSELPLISSANVTKAALSAVMLGCLTMSQMFTRSAKIRPCTSTQTPAKNHKTMINAPPIVVSPVSCPMTSQTKRSGDLTARPAGLSLIASVTSLAVLSATMTSNGPGKHGTTTKGVSAATLPMTLVVNASSHLSTIQTSIPRSGKDPLP